MLSAFVIAFAMYSKIPMPRVDWNEKNMKYAMCFFPVIGMVIGALEIGAFYLLNYLGFGSLFRASVLVLIPVIVTGGIHVDGLLDTTDAISSHAERERKLEILKDSHTGAFAILGCVIYFMAALAVWSEVSAAILPSVVVVFTLSRALSGMAVVSFKSARSNGLLYTFSDGAHKIVVRGVLIVLVLAAAVLMVMLNPVAGAVGVAAAVVTFCYYRWFSYKEFGGITGDLAGYFLQLCELFVPLAMVVAERIGAL